MKQEVLRQLIDERVLNQLAHDQGLRIGDQQLHAALVALPVFQQSGGFNNDLYERLVAQSGIYPGGVRGRDAAIAGDRPTA
jgi:peptidyl-prolyl cis-trans isomerase D